MCDSLHLLDLFHLIMGGWGSLFACSLFVFPPECKATTRFNSILAPVAEKVVAARHTIRGRSVGQIYIVTVSTTVQCGVELRGELRTSNLGSDSHAENNCLRLGLDCHLNGPKKDAEKQAVQTLSKYNSSRCEANRYLVALKEKFGGWIYSS